jgi:hypothetical protein
MQKLTCAIVAAGAVLAADTTTAAVTCDPMVTDCPPPTGISCDNASLTNGVIWPPNHKMVEEDIMDVSSGAGAVTIQITSIYQSEPVNALGSGNTAPDGIIDPTTPGIAYVRAERAGPGTGRIYIIAYTATDPVGNTCSGTLTANVPHDQGQGFTPMPTGNWYDSTKPAP